LNNPCFCFEGAEATLLKITNQQVSTIKTTENQRYLVTFVWCWGMVLLLDHHLHLLIRVQ